VALMAKKVLLVDDTVTVTTLEKIYLGPLYDYLEARNGDEAFQRAVAELPDLILMDVNMPVVNGIDALRNLKAEPATRHIPVIMVTTRSEALAVEQCRSLGCAEFLTKPIDREVLLSTVKRFLE
jgi:CheY-like chemotaxis protein